MYTPPLRGQVVRHFRPLNLFGVAPAHWVCLDSCCEIVDWGVWRWLQCHSNFSSLFWTYILYNTGRRRKWRDSRNFARNLTCSRFTLNHAHITMVLINHHRWREHESMQESTCMWRTWTTRSTTSGLGKSLSRTEQWRAQEWWLRVAGARYSLLVTFNSASSPFNYSAFWNWLK